MPSVNNGDGNYLSQGTEQTDHDIGPPSPSEASHLHLPRPASPAKRTRSQRDGDDETADSNSLSIDRAAKALQSPKKPSTLSQHASPMPSRTKNMSKEVEMNAQSNASAPSAKNGVVGDSSNDSSSGASRADSHNGSHNEQPATSSPPTSMDTDDDGPSDRVVLPPCPSSFDEQYQMVKKLIDSTEQREGLAGYLVSMKWLERVIARTSYSNDHALKGVKEGHVGPIDNRDLLIDANNLHINDKDGNEFIPLKHGLRVGDDCEVLPREARDLVVSWYGQVTGSPNIVRFMHNTSDNDALPNFQYELYPPVFTIQRVTQESQGRGLDLLGDQRKRAPRIVASRSEKYQDFLRVAKQAVNIDINTKVQVWKVVETLPVDMGRAAIPTPESSRSGSPMPQPVQPQIGPVPNLSIDLKTLTNMAEGTQRDLIDIKDETANPKYNGSFTLAGVGFPEHQTLILEEQVRNSSREEYLSSKRVSVSEESQTSQALSASSVAKTRLYGDNARRSPTPSGILTRGRTNKRGKVKGTVGLQNLGNTCYMNSALQCIRSVEELTQYILSGKYKDELNPDNPLGYNGTIAKAYAGLIASLYGQESTFAPRNFKNALGRAQPLFSGYGQQDSQEFVSFLMDGLHEDLNRVRKKPYRENPDSDDKTIHDPEAIRKLGETYRENYRARNDSIVMDLFNGFYKNTMVCPICDKISITFDPFSQVTLQLPVENTFQHAIFVSLLNRPPVTVNVDIDKSTSIKGLKEYVAKRLPGVKADCLVMGEEYSEKFYKVFEDNEVLSEAQITQSDILWMYELDDVPTNWPPVDKKKSRVARTFGIFTGSSLDSLPEMSSHFADRMAVPLVHRIATPAGRTKFGLSPSIILVTREEAQDLESITRKVFQKIQTMTTRDLLADVEGSVSSQTETLDGVDVSNHDVASNQGYPRVQAESVEGDDELVDVSMRNVDATRAKTPVDEDGPNAKPAISKLLDQTVFIDSGVRNLFTLRLFTSTSDIIPTNYSGLNDNDKFARLEDRQHPPHEKRRGSGGSRTSHLPRWGRQDLSPATSEDELNAQDSEVTSRPTSPAVSDEEMIHSSSGLKQNPKSSSSLRRFGSRLKASSGRSKKSGRSTSRGEPNYLIRLGDGIIVDWSLEGYDQLFGGHSDDDFRGCRTDTNKEVVSDPELEEKRKRRSARKRSGVTLDECFVETAKSEILSEENAWYCNRCKELRRASKTLELWTVPDVLVVHLKRFSSQSRWRDKVEILVDFPVEGLDLTGKVGLPEESSLIFDLFAVDNHYGSLGGGHYTSYAKNFLDGKWYEYNDSMVSSVNGASVVTRAAYLLFYRRRVNGPLGPEYLQKLVLDSKSEPSESRSPSPAGRNEPSLPAPVDREDELPSYNSHEQDEGIFMIDANDEADVPIPTSEYHRPGFIGPQREGPLHQPQWSFDNLNRGDAENDEDDADTLSVGAAEGSDAEEKMMEDFGDEITRTGTANVSHELSTNADKELNVSEFTRDMGSNSDGEVADVRVASDGETE